MKKSGKKTLRTETINGFDITYEMEEGKIFAVGYCPICLQKESSIQLGLDPGAITAGKLRTHMELTHLKKSKDSN
jgi:hypothetical protein